MPRCARLWQPNARAGPSRLVQTATARLLVANRGLPASPWGAAADTVADLAAGPDESQHPRRANAAPLQTEAIGEPAGDVAGLRLSRLRRRDRCYPPPDPRRSAARRPTPLAEPCRRFAGREQGCTANRLLRRGGLAPVELALLARDPKPLPSGATAQPPHLLARDLDLAARRRDAHALRAIPHRSSTLHVQEPTGGHYPPMPVTRESPNAGIWARRGRC